MISSKVAQGELPMMAENSWTTDLRAVYDRLKLHGVVDDVDGIPLDAFIMTVGTIGKFKRRPITNYDMRQAKKVGKRQLARREAYDRAAAFLQDEINEGNWREHPNMAGHVQQWSAAIAFLKMPRNVTEMPGSWMRATKPGDAARGWTFMATEIMGWILWALRTNRKEELRQIGVARFTRDALAFIGVDDLPNEREILKVMRKNLLDARDE